MTEEAVASSGVRTSMGRLVIRVFRFFRRWPVIPVLIVMMLVVAAVFAPWLAPHDPIAGDLAKRNIVPMWYAKGSSEYILGTDPQGRDIISRVIYGARISLLISAIVLGLGGILGTTLGLVSGYSGGMIDEVLMRFVDFTLGVPFILVALVVAVVFGNSLPIIIILLIVFSWNAFARQARAEALRIKTLDYVAQARVAGASQFRIMYKHLFPGVMDPIVVVATWRVGMLILTEATLSFLGVGVPEPTATWGSMVAGGRDYIAAAWWVCFFPGVAILLTVLAFNFLGDWLRDRLDPRLRQL
ncbi:MAG: ABC transporter permease [Chloroflexota bacterium]|nr:ABC transporter permease [Chloroflexota bacterium]